MAQKEKVTGGTIPGLIAVMDSNNEPGEISSTVPTIVFSVDSFHAPNCSDSRQTSPQGKSVWRTARNTRYAYSYRDGEGNYFLTFSIVAESIKSGTEAAGGKLAFFRLVYNPPINNRVLH